MQAIREKSRWWLACAHWHASVRGVAEMAPEDAGLVGTPYFWTGVAGAVVLWAAVMVVLWL